MIENGKKPQFQSNGGRKRWSGRRVLMGTMLLMLSQAVCAVALQGTSKSPLPLTIKAKQMQSSNERRGFTTALPTTVRAQLSSPWLSAPYPVASRQQGVVTRVRVCNRNTCRTTFYWVAKPSRPLSQAPTRQRREVRSQQHPYQLIPINVPRPGRLTAASIRAVEERLPTLIARPPVISRDAWGANAPPAKSRQLSDCFVKYIVVHHTASTPAPKQAVGAFLRGVENYHNTRGFGGLAYRALVGLDGKLYEGFRRQGNSAETALEGGVASSHARNFNCGSYGIALIGDYENKHRLVLQSPVGKTLSQAIAYVAMQPSRSRLYYDAAGQLQLQIPQLIGHKQTGHSHTNCPGKNTSLVELNNHVRALLREHVEAFIRTHLPKH